jgi:hypothetical protein
MPGLVPGIHDFASAREERRGWSGQLSRFALLPGHDDIFRNSEQGIDLPEGQITHYLVQPPSEKYFTSPIGQIRIT